MVPAACDPASRGRSGRPAPYLPLILILILIARLARRVGHVRDLVPGSNSYLQRVGTSN